MPAAGVDPRTEPQTEDDVRPVVMTARSGPNNVVLLGALAVFGLLLFAVLNARRQTSPLTSSTSFSSPIQAPPPLSIPPGPTVVPFEQSPVLEAPPQQVVIQTTTAPPAVPRTLEPNIVVMPSPTPAQDAPVEQSRTPPVSGQPALIVDNTSVEGAAEALEPPQRGREQPAAGGSGGTQSSGGRVRATMFRNRSTTVPQGTLIPAVLDTALDSSRPGLARAIISRDARGFDGSRVLIPRGSRLIGEYRSDAQLGQKRVLVTWTRLIRPDGASIALESPAGDPLGRGGIGGRVDSHFLERFGGSILQSALDLGVNVATAKAASGNVVLGLPGQLSNLSGLLPSQQISPTIRVKQGTAVTIFVARDLDFTGVEGRP